MFDRLMNEEKGFTLVELLVTISILAVLFGIVTLSLTGVGADAETTVNDAEFGVVQSAVDIGMADHNLSSVDALTDTCLDGDEPLDSSSSPAVTIGDYLRVDSTNTSKCTYSWTSAGVVSQGTCDC